MNFDEDNEPLAQPPADAGAEIYSVGTSTENLIAPLDPVPTPHQSGGSAFDPSVPEDLRVPWGWLELLLFAVLAIGGAFLISVLLVMVFAAFGVHLSQLQNSESEQGIYAIVSQVVLFFVLLGYLAAQMRLRFRMPFWRTIGWRPLEADRLQRAIAYLGFIMGGFLLALAVQIASARFGTKAKLPMEALFQDRRTALLILLMAVFVAPVIEETIFRGYIYPVVARRFGVGVGIVATGTLFGLLHAPQLWTGWVQIALLVVVGIVFTYARAVRKTVLASYLLHVSYNFFVSVAFLIGSHWLTVLTPGS
jgi:membrane protease YdiL (CAAX protease family)